MTLVFAGVCSHAPGITGRADRAKSEHVDAIHGGFRRLRQAIENADPEALIIVASEHFANFFMDNMPAYCMGMAEFYEGPIEEESFLRIRHTQIPGAPELSRRLIENVLNDIDVAYAEEWKFDHGIMVPLHFLTPGFDLPIVPININCQVPPFSPMHRVYEFGRALRRACDAVPDRIALIGTGGISHWPATPDSGRINEAWDRAFLDRFIENRRDELIAYNDEEIYREGGQGGFEIRTFVTVAGATEGRTGELWLYLPVPTFSVGCTIATMAVA